MFGCMKMYFDIPTITVWCVKILDIFERVYVGLLYILLIQKSFI